MRIRYRIPFRREIIVIDHWPIPLRGGVCRIIEEAGRAKALEITLHDQPLDSAPYYEEVKDGNAVANIIDRDYNLCWLKHHLDAAMRFLECFFDIDLATDEIEAFYEPESPQEKNKIPIRSMSVGKHTRPLPLPFDLITRAIMAAEQADGPKFVTALVLSARKSLSEQEYINSFRYAFFLIEALYGEGKFKKDDLKAALKRSQDFKSMVEYAFFDRIKPKHDANSDTEKLLQNDPSVDDIIDHIVEMRGFYFHGNIKRKDKWDPNEQFKAEALALLSIGIIRQIAHNAASPMFAPKLAERHFQDAVKAGATRMFVVKFLFQEPDEQFERHGVIHIQTPGTIVTGKLANNVAQEFLRRFEHGAPAASLISAECRVKDSSEMVFRLDFHTKAP